MNQEHQEQQAALELARVLEALERTPVELAPPGALESIQRQLTVVAQALERAVLAEVPAVRALMAALERAVYPRRTVRLGVPGVPLAADPALADPPGLAAAGLAGVLGPRSGPGAEPPSRRPVAEYLAEVDQVLTDQELLERRDWADLEAAGLRQMAGQLADRGEWHPGAAAGHLAEIRYQAERQAAAHPGLDSRQRERYRQHLVGSALLEAYPGLARELREALAERRLELGQDQGFAPDQVELRPPPAGLSRHYQAGLNLGNPQGLIQGLPGV